MRDRPQGADLLAEARRLMSDKVLPGLSSETRYPVLMALRAMDLAECELRANSEEEAMLCDQLRQLVGSEASLSELPGLLSKDIRNGAFDVSNDLYAFLRQVVTFKLKETNSAKVRA